MDSTQQNSNKKRKTVEYNRYGYFFIAPFFIVYGLFSLWPLIYTVILSFTENYSRGLEEVGPTFNGLKNYIGVIIETDKSGAVKEGARLFNTATFKALYNTFYMWIINFIPQIGLSLMLAAWFTDTKVKLKGQGAYKIMIFMPNIITAATLAVLFYSLFNFPSGPINQMLIKAGLLDAPFNFFQSKTATRFLVGFIQFWMWYGNTMIILIAGILGISPSLFEAAMVDGADSKQIFSRITLPMIKPILLYTLVTSCIGGLQMFDIPQLLNADSVGNGGGPDYASRTITMYIRELVFKSKDYGKAGAVSMILFVVTLTLSILLFYVMRDKDSSTPKKIHKKGAL